MPVHAHAMGAGGDGHEGFVLWPSPGLLPVMERVEPAPIATLVDDRRSHKWLDLMKEHMVDVEKRFQDTLVEDVYEILVQEPAMLKQGRRVRDAIDEMLRNPTSHMVYVIDDDMKLIGAITTATLLELIGHKVGVLGTSALSFYRFIRDTLGDDIGGVTQKITAVRRETRITDALNTMIKNRWDALPVVDDEDRLIGELVSLELFHKGKDLFE